MPGTKTAVEALGLLKVWYMLNNSSFQPRQQLLIQYPRSHLAMVCGPAVWPPRYWIMGLQSLEVRRKCHQTADTVAMVSLWYHLWQKAIYTPRKINGWNLRIHPIHPWNSENHLNQTIMTSGSMSTFGGVDSLFYLFLICSLFCDICHITNYCIIYSLYWVYICLCTPEHDDKKRPPKRTSIEWGLLCSRWVGSMVQQSEFSYRETLHLTNCAAFNTKNDSKKKNSVSSSIESDFLKFIPSTWSFRYDRSKHTVDGRNPANQLTCSLSHYLQGF